MDVHALYSFLILLLSFPLTLAVLAVSPSSYGMHLPYNRRSPKSLIYHPKVNNFIGTSNGGHVFAGNAAILEYISSLDGFLTSGAPQAPHYPLARSKL
jgi:hypothetical protein